MANGLYAKARQEFLVGNYDWSSMTLRIALVNAQYTPDLESHVYIGGPEFDRAMIVNTLLNGSAAMSGYARTAPTTFTAVEPPYNNTYENTAVALVIYKDIEPSPNVGELVAYIDNAVGLPYTVEGKDIVFAEDINFGGVFRI